MKLGIKIMLRDGHFITCETTEADYSRYLAAWKNNAVLFLDGVGQIGSHRWTWSVATKDIVAMHTMWIQDGPVQVPQRALTPPPPAPLGGFYGMS